MAEQKSEQAMLFEIGCEEIPAKLLTRVLSELPTQAEALLAAARLSHGVVRALGTPRRITLIVDELVARQPDLSERVVGPPVSAAFAADGTPARAGIGFAQKNGIDPAALERGEVEGKKGEYAIAARFVEGKATTELLPALLAQLVGGLSWPKSQRWGWSETTFVRPLQWLCALYGSDVIPVTFAGLIAGRTTRGHRFLAPDELSLANPSEYVEALRRAFVIVDSAERRQLVNAELARVGGDTSARIRPDGELLDEVVNLVEYPVAVAGSFDPAFLDVPPEVIVTAMRTHQRYFALENSDGSAAPGFVAVAGTVVRDVAIVRQGFERAVTPRLADARFFFLDDLKKPMTSWNERLGSVVFQAKLGDQAKTIGHKITRIVRATTSLATNVTCDAAAAARAALLCKADLASGVVGEFPELQGVMGMHYARRAGESDTVASAIAEHYLPKGQGSGLPGSVEGALVGLADRMDTLLGCFATGQVPSGSADPYGLRRAAIGVLSILLDRGPDGASFSVGTGWPVTIDTLIEAAANGYGDALKITDAHRHSLAEFLRTRLRGLLLEEGSASQDIDAALAAQSCDPCDARVRARALALVPAAARAVFKRVANILDDAEAKGIAAATEVDAGQFVADVERNLWDAIGQARDSMSTAFANRNYRQLFETLVTIEPEVSAFFDKGGVMVMDPDESLRANRLALLTKLIAPFARVADFRLLAQPSGGAS